MKAINKSRSQVGISENVGDASARLTLSVIGGASLLIGLWAAACFLGALVSTGPVGLIKGYFAAVTGM